MQDEPAAGGRLPALDEIIPVPGLRGGRYLGLQTIRLDTIVGTAEPRSDFDRNFRPTSDRGRERWEEVALAQRRGAAMPPIEVYRAGGLHYVSDGHHRVSIAAATGQQVIEAYVTEVPAARPAGIARTAEAARAQATRPNHAEGEADDYS